MDPAEIFGKATTLHQAGQLLEAARLYEQILALVPEHPETLYLRGAIDLQSDRFADAVPWLERCVARQPDHSAAQTNLAAAYLALRRYDDALTVGARALQIDPSSAGAWMSRGSAFFSLGRHEEAVANFDRGLALAPHRTDVLLARGKALNLLGRHEEAIASCDRALILQPGLIDALMTRVRALDSLGRDEDVVSSCNRLIDQQPAFADAYAFRARANDALKRLEEALDDYDAALQIDPEFRIAPGDALYVALRLCHWDGLAERIEAVLRSAEAGKLSTQPLPVIAAGAAAAQQRDIATLYCGAVTQHITPSPLLPPNPAETVHLGYISSDLHDHAVGQLVVGLLERHDRSQFEVTAFASGGDPKSPIRQRIAGAVHRLIDVSAMTDQEIVTVARQLGIQIAVDLNGHTAGARIGVFAARAAPIQVNYLGYPGTTGLPAIDYIIGDPVVTPLEHRDHFSERVVTLPHSYQPNDPRRAEAAQKTFARSDLGLPERGFVYCAFNSTFKITPDVFDIWMRLLGETEGSVLWLLEGHPAAQRNLRREASQRGVDPDRLIFAPRIGIGDHLARHRAADLFLDTFNYNAHTTASDALMMGVPVLTRRGDTFASRVAASLLTSVGLPELVTEDAEQYEALAQVLATDHALLGSLRRRLSKGIGASPLFDIARYTRNLEAAYRTMWQRYEAEMPPDHITVIER